ncbi:MAG: HlyD family efflux transporter periplasmic adaptor subunit [Rikenellaceae bacterium]
MDKQIDPKILRKEKQTRYIKIAAIFAAVVIAFIAIGALLRPTIQSDELRFGKVSRGDVILSLTAQGSALPISEQVINSPITSNILEVYKRSGDSVVAGESIMKLDLQAVEAELSRLCDEMNMKTIQFEQLILQNRSDISNMELNLEVQKIEQEQVVEELKNEIYLDSLGAGTPENVRKMNINVRLGDMKLKESQAQLENARALKLADQKVKQLELNMLKRDVEQKRQLVKEAQIISPKSSVLSFVNEQVGEQVSAGSKIAMLSDISAFKISASISNSYADRIRTGGEVVVMAGKERLKGVISNINPIAQDNSIDFTIQLEDSRNKVLRSELSCDVQIIESRIENTMYIPKAAYYMGEGYYKVFVVEGDKLIGRNVQLGRSNFEQVQVISGLDEGEEVVVSEMSKYLNSDELKMR